MEEAFSNVDSRIILTGFPEGSCEPVRLRVERSLEGLLARYATALSEITTAVALPGADGMLVQCRIVAHTTSGEPVIVEESAETVQSALDHATERLERRLGPAPISPQIRRRLRDIWRRRARRPAS